MGGGRAGREREREGGSEGWNGFANKPSCTVGDVGNSRRHYEMQAYAWPRSKDAIEWGGWKFL